MVYLRFEHRDAGYHGSLLMWIDHDGDVMPSFCKLDSVAGCVCACACKREKSQGQSISKTPSAPETKS